MDTRAMLEQLAGQRADRETYVTSHIRGARFGIGKYSVRRTMRMTRRASEAAGIPVYVSQEPHPKEEGWDWHIRTFYRQYELRAVGTVAQLQDYFRLLMTMMGEDTPDAD
jgi:hypothetical protein